MTSPSTRVLFVDLARAIAVLFMIQGHTIQVLLDPQYQGSLLFDGWLYLRGLTSCAFLLLSGFSFSLATSRHWNDYVAATPRLWRRLFRFGVFLMLGYAMRIPIRPLSDFARATTDQWRSFAVVDILQLVAVTLAALQALVWLSGTRRRLAVSSLGLAGAIVLLAPLAWQIQWHAVLPVWLASYLSPGTGSLFPLFPWAAYILFGASLGAWFTTWGERQSADGASRAFLRMGTGLIAAGVVLHLIPFSPYGPLDFWKISPNLFLVKTGSVLLVLSAVARASRTMAALPPVVSALSRESLVIYLVHICILYGSIWSDGLYQRVGPRLGPAPTFGWIVFLLISMSVLAWVWHECKRRSVQVPALVRVAVTAGLVYAIA